MPIIRTDKVINIHRCKFFIQSKIQRLTEPYRANCTKSWLRTPFTELIQDFDGSTSYDKDDNVRVAKKYNIAVKMYLLSDMYKFEYKIN